MTDTRTTTVEAAPDASGLVIYNTMTRQKESFSTIEPGKVRMYVCGVTVYDEAHIGHAFTFLVFDVIRRYLEHLGYDVDHVQNYTDIDDKIINRANAEGLDPTLLTESLIDNWSREVLALNLLPAKRYPRATQEVDEIIAMIEGLIARGHAYAIDGDVYFRVRSFSGYGKLSRRDVDDLRAGARIEVDARKEDPVDFALWKGAKPGEPSWPSPWGDGRPGWHIECSAMSTHHLHGQLDIHGGGSDLIFPHHENEIAQSEAFSGDEPFSRYWVHAGTLRLGSEKMSKSLGNVINVSTLIERGRTEAFRLMALQSHYRVPLTYTEKGLEAANSGLQRLRAAARATGVAESGGEDLGPLTAATEQQFHAAMRDDFDTPRALAALFELARGVNRVAAAGGSASLGPARDTLNTLAGILGFDLTSAPGTLSSNADVETLMTILIEVRKQLRGARQFAAADDLRDRLRQEGFILEDTRDGTTWKRETTT